MDSIVNDAAASLLSRAYEDQTTRLSLILGTGTNAAIHLPVTALDPAKFGERPQAWHDEAKHVLVNTEMSMFGKDIYTTSRWDDYLNKTHRLPDFQPLEHLISGRYLGEIVRLILVEAIKTAGLFDGEMPHKMNEPYSFDTSTLAVFESDTSSTLSEACKTLQARHPLRKPATLGDLAFIRKVSELVSKRAAAYLATTLHALWCLRAHAEGLTPATAGTISVGCNGSVIERYPGFRDNTQAFLDQLTTLSGATAGSVVLEPAYESAILGAAVGVCCLEGQSRRNSE